MRKSLRNSQFLLILSFLGLITFSNTAYSQDTISAPEIATGYSNKEEAVGSRIMAVTAHPDATKVAYDILSRGGTAADAGIAAQLMLGLVEPQSSGLGGGGFALYYDALNQVLRTYDGRETAPDSAGKYLFNNNDGSPMGFYEAAIGGRAVGAPGIPKLLETLHDNFGQLNWADLFQPVIEKSETGYEVTARTHKMLVEERPRFKIDTKSLLYFYPDGSTPLEAGEVINNPDYALTLKDMARNKTSNFYEGEISKNIVEKVRQNKGLLAIEDLSSYEVKERKAVCKNYREYKICSMGQPSSGGLTLLSALGILENFDLKSLGSDNPKSYHLISEASRLAFEDRNQYIADADFVQTPDTLLLDEIYLKTRAAYINENEAMKNVFYGVPLGWDDKRQMKDGALKDTGTSHITMVDSYGNILSMTTSIENAFGSRLMTNGFLLNNQLTDFSFKASDGEGNLIANRVEGGKRPRSSMTPVIVFDPQGNPFMALGSAGGSRIIGYVLQRIISVIDWDMDLQESFNAPNILHRGKKLEVELTGIELAKPLKDLGHPVLVGQMNSGLTGIEFKGDKIIGATDPRRDGFAMGD